MSAPQGRESVPNEQGAHCPRCATCGRPAKYCIRMWDGSHTVHEPACGYHQHHTVSAMWRLVKRRPIGECDDDCPHANPEADHA